MSGLTRDVRYALRQWRSAPGFTAFSLGVLAVGIGGSLALFGLFDALALRTLPVDRPDRLVAITATAPTQSNASGFLPIPSLRAIEQRQRVFSAMAGHIPGGVSTFDNDRPVSHGAAFTTPGYFETVGVRPVIGRLLGADDARSHVVVISDGYWQRRYDRDPNVIGQTVRLETTAFTIVGVAPSRFSGLQVASQTDFFLPIESVRTLFELLPEGLEMQLTHAIGRLADGVSLDQARSQLQAMWPAVAADTVPPATWGIDRDAWLARRLDVVSASRGFSYMRDWYAAPLQLLVMSTAVLLLIISVNLAGLVWSRAIARQHEIDVRMAIGASPVRIARQLSIESLLLTATGTLLALPIAWAAGPALLRMMWNDPAEAVLPLDLTPGWRVSVVTIATVATTGLGIALLPAWKTYRRARAGWSAAVSSSGSGRVTSRANDVLMVAQVAIAVVLLVSAGLVTASLLALRDRADFPTEGIHLTSLAARTGAYADLDDVRRHMRGLVDRAMAVPGVTAAALSSPEPLMGLEAGEERRVVTAADVADGPRLRPTLVSVSPDYFRTMGVPLMRGRDFSWADDENSRTVAILSLRSAERLFPNGDAIGRAVRIGTLSDFQHVEVVGIVADARLADLHADEPVFVFLPLLQRLDFPTVIARSTERRATLGPDLRAALESTGREDVWKQVTLDGQIDASLLRERLMALGARWFGGLAVVLVLAGMAGVLSQFVARRTREIGTRVALGASPAVIRAMLLRRTLMLTVAGLLIGLPIAYVVATMLTSQLTAVSAAHAMTFALATSTILIVSIVAAWAPTRRALSIKPAEALKAE